MLLIVQAAATWFMTGVIWFVQVVQYPLFSAAGGDAFRAYHRQHVRRTGWIVGPPMLVEAVCAVATVIETPQSVPSWQAWAGLGLLAVIWGSTWLLQVPQHRRLEAGFDHQAHRRLVATNALRVGAWSARAVLLALWLR